MGFQKRVLNDEQTFELLENVCRRPHMYYGEVNTFQDLLAFINGISCGMHPDHGCLGEFADFVYERFGASRQRRWTTVVLEEFSDYSFHRACEALGGLIREWKHTLE